MSTHNDSFYTEEEQKIINKNLDIRGKMIDAMIEDGIPTKTGEVRVIKEVIESMDNRITETAKLRLKHEENANAANDAKMAAELLKAIASKKDTGTYIPRNVDVELADDIIETVEIVSGELEINPPTLTLDDIDN